MIRLHTWIDWILICRVAIDGKSSLRFHPSSQSSQKTACFPQDVAPAGKENMDDYIIMMTHIDSAKVGVLFSLFVFS